MKTQIQIQNQNQNQNQNEGKSAVVIDLVSSKDRADRQFMLFRLQINGARKYIVYARQGECEDVCAVNASSEESLTLFERLCELEVSPEHICDVVEDAFREQYL